MANTRKTVPLTDLIDYANNLNKISSDRLKDKREAVNDMVVKFLLENNAYAGFSYLNKEDLAGEAKTPGIIFDHTSALKHVFPDKTRVHYHTHRKLLPDA